jgi:APA family basic amino acid/polyamine antiporter
MVRRGDGHRIDAFVFEQFAEIGERRRPGFFVGIPAGLWDIATFAELSNIGTLFAFILVSAGVIVLRKKQPDRPRTFRVPFVPLFPIISIVCCLVLMMGLPLLTWLRFFAWLLIGLVIYFSYSKSRSTLNVSTVQGR